MTTRKNGKPPAESLPDPALVAANDRIAHLETVERTLREERDALQGRLDAALQQVEKLRAELGAAAAEFETAQAQLGAARGIIRDQQTMIRVAEQAPPPEDADFLEYPKFLWKADPNGEEGFEVPHRCEDADEAGDLRRREPDTWFDHASEATRAWHAARAPQP